MTLYTTYVGKQGTTTLGTSGQNNNNFEKISRFIEGPKCRGEDNINLDPLKQAAKVLIGMNWFKVISGDCSPQNTEAAVKIHKSRGN
jgi:hypothetical protein